MLEDVLKEHGAIEVDAMAVYKDMFGLGYGLIQENGEVKGQFKANPIGYYKNGSSKGHFRVFFDDTFEETLKELQEADFAIVNGVTYFGRKNLQAHASKMYAMIFDLDGVTDKTLDLFLNFCEVKEYDFKPMPNYIALSGHGLHLYYIFEEPIPLFPNIKIQLKALKYGLTEILWNDDTSTLEKRQYQGINQGFRPIGGKTKIDGVRVRAFKLRNTPYSIEELNKYVDEENKVDLSRIYKERTMTLAEAKKKYPEWYADKIVNKQPRQYWDIKPDLYNWWKRKLLEPNKVTYHHRYFCVMCLAIYGAKCNIPYEQVEEDALGLIDYMNQSVTHGDDEFGKADVYSALECYDRRYCTFPLDDIEKLSAISIPRNKRNGRKQKDHIKLMNFVRDEINGNKDWRNKEGAPTKEEIVKSWRAENPKGKKEDCHRATGLSRDTIRKWWD